MNSTYSLVYEFLCALKRSIDAKSCLYLDVGDFEAAPERLDGFELVTGHNWASSLKASDSFDLIYGNLPLGLHREDHEINDNQLKIGRNWIYLYKALQYLSDSGVAVFLVEPSVFSLNDGKKFVSTLNSQGFHVSAIYNAPQGLLKPETTIRPALVQISRMNADAIFVGELNHSEQIAQLVDNLRHSRYGANLSRGMCLSHGAFHSFDRIETELQLDALESQYKQFKRHPIREIVVEINIVQREQKFNEASNSVYIQRVGNIRVVDSLDDISGKHSNYFQVVLQPDISAKYMRCFLSSEMGQRSLRSIGRGSIVSNLPKSELLDLLVSIPAAEDQETIAATSLKLGELRTAVDGLGGEFALNPMGSRQLLQQIERMLDAIGGLSDADKILSLCRAGECTTVEFKETLSLDVKKGTREKYIELSALKTVAAFLNTSGGVLLVGVNDDAEITGIDVEISKHHKNSDKFLLHFKNLLKSKIGEEYYPFISYQLVGVQNMQVLTVTCQPAKSPCFLGGLEFYVRTNPATDKLEGQKLVEYVRNHFS